MRSISRLALSSPSALRSTALARSRRCRPTSMRCSAGDAAELLQHARRRARAGSVFIRAIVSPRRCTSFGARCLKTSAASSSPSDISRMAASSRPVRPSVRRPSVGAGSGGVSPLTQPRTMLATAAGFCLGQLRARRRACVGRAAAAAPAAAGAAARCASSTHRVELAARLRGGAGGASAACSAGRTRPKRTSSATSASASRHGARLRSRSSSLGLLPQRQRRRRVGAASTLNGALITLTESPRSLLKPMLSLHQRGQLLDLLVRQRHACVVLPLASVPLRWLTTTAAFRRLTLPVALRVTRTVLSTS